MGARQLQAVSLTPPEEEREREQAFENWLLSANTDYLECREGRHDIPGLTDTRTHLEVIRGVCYIEASCQRCGVVKKKRYGVRDGLLQGSTGSSYDYSKADGYLLPKEATGRGGSAMDKEHRGMVRLEILARAFKARGTSLNRVVAADERRAAKADAKVVPFSG